MVLRLLILSYSGFLIACSPSKKLSNNVAVNPGNIDTLAGLNIIKRSDCFTCHKFREKLIGPSFLDIAVKYEFNLINIDKLSDKIVKGGKGSWGNLPMVPHASMSKEDANSVVKYILSNKQ